MHGCPQINNDCPCFYSCTALHYITFTCISKQIRHIVSLLFNMHTNHYWNLKLFSWAWWQMYEHQIIYISLCIPFSKYCSSPLRRASSCCSDNWNNFFPGILGKLKSGNSFFNFVWRLSNSRYRREHKCLPAIYILNTCKRIFRLASIQR